MRLASIADALTIFIKFAVSVAKITQIPITSSSILLVNDYHISLFAYVISLLKKLPFLCYLQIPPADPNRQTRMALKGVDHFVAVSQQTKQEWVDFGFADEAIEVIHNGTDTHKFKPAPDFLATRNLWEMSERAKVVSYVGRLDVEKGIEHLIKAIALLAHQEPDIKANDCWKTRDSLQCFKGHRMRRRGHEISAIARAIS